MFCCTFLYALSSFAIILMGKRELVSLLSLSSWCLIIVVWLFLAVPWVSLQFVIVVFPDHTHLLFLMKKKMIGFQRSRYVVGNGELVPENEIENMNLYQKSRWNF